jgi:putative sigma-54 modulation protein
MQIQVHSIHFDADRKLLDFIDQRLKKLARFHDNIISGEVFLKVDNSDDRQNKIVEIKVLVPGKELFVKKQSQSFEESTGTSIEALRRQIRKYRTKQGIS